MFKKISATVFCALAITGCGSSSDDKKSNNKDLGPVDTSSVDVTDTRICDDTSKSLNIFGTFEQVLSAEGEGRMITRVRFENLNSTTNGVMILELSCQTNSGFIGSAKGRVNYTRNGNTIQTLNELNLSASSPQNNSDSCNFEHKFPLINFQIAPKNSCLILTFSEGEQRVIVPSKKNI